MIQYALKCDNGHSFDSWFQSAQAYDKLSASGLVTCAVCASSSVEKAVMTPRVTTARNENDRNEKAEKPGMLSEPASPAEQALAEIRNKIESTSDYVGMNFATEARAMHDGDIPTRAIYGEAKPDDARKLVEDGVPVAPLPFVPNRKSN